MKLGKHQLALLSTLGSPPLMLVLPSKRSRSLMKRGLLRSMAPDGHSFICVTPAGLRELADALARGDIKQQLPPKRGDA